MTVAQIESDDVNRDAQSSGGTMLLPVHVLGTHYMVMTYPQAQTPEIASLTGSPNGAGRLLIVGTQPETMVTLKLSSTSSGVVMGTLPGLAPGGLPDVPARRRRSFPGLEREPRRRSVGHRDLTSQPVAVFSGNMTTTYGRTADNLHSPDMAHEQMPPVYAWSYNYVAAALPPQRVLATRCWAANRHAALVALAVDGLGATHRDIDIVGPSGPIHTEKASRPGRCWS